MYTPAPKDVFDPRWARAQFLHTIDNYRRALPAIEDEKEYARVCLEILIMETLIHLLDKDL